MKAFEKTGLVLITVAAVLLGAMQIVTGIYKKNVPAGTITIVKAPEQTAAMQNEAFKTEEYTAPVIDGKNVALGAKASCNGFNDVYRANNVVDGARATYWEGSPDEIQSIITVDLEDTHKIHTIVIALNPAVIWSKRTQTICFQVSDDGENFTELVGTKKYEFDPKTGNQIVVEFDATKTRYVRAVITGNTGAVAGQVAEFEIYE